MTKRTLAGVDLELEIITSESSSVPLIHVCGYPGYSDLWLQVLVTGELFSLLTVPIWAHRLPMHAPIGAPLPSLRQILMSAAPELFAVRA